MVCIHNRVFNMSFVGKEGNWKQTSLRKVFPVFSFVPVYDMEVDVKLSRGIKTTSRKENG